MRNSSLATGGKNRLGVRREASPLRGLSPALRAAKTAMWYREFLHQTARSETSATDLEFHCRGPFPRVGFSLTNSIRKAAWGAVL
jgi:hypothetical protein